MKTKAQKAARAAGCLNDLVRGNKYMRKETKSKIYKATLPPIVTCTRFKSGNLKKTDKCWEQMRS